MERRPLNMGQQPAINTEQRSSILPSTHNIRSPPSHYTKPNSISRQTAPTIMGSRNIGEAESNRYQSACLNEDADISNEMGAQWGNTVATQMDLAQVFKTERRPAAMTHSNIMHQYARVTGYENRFQSSFRGDSGSSLEMRMANRLPQASENLRWCQDRKGDRVSNIDKVSNNDRVSNLQNFNDRERFLGSTASLRPSEMFSGQSNTAFKTRSIHLDSHDRPDGDDIIRPRFSLSLVRKDTPYTSFPLQPEINPSILPIESQAEHSTYNSSHRISDIGRNLYASTLMPRTLNTNSNTPNSNENLSRGEIQSANLESQKPQRRKLPTLRKPEEKPKRPPQPIWTSHTSTRVNLNSTFMSFILILLLKLKYIVIIKISKCPQGSWVKSTSALGLGWLFLSRFSLHHWLHSCTNIADILISKWNSDSDPSNASSSCREQSLPLSNSIPLPSGLHVRIMKD